MSSRVPPLKFPSLPIALPPTVLPYCSSTLLLSQLLPLSSARFLPPLFLSLRPCIVPFLPHSFPFSTLPPFLYSRSHPTSHHCFLFQHCPACSYKLVLLLDKFGELRARDPHDERYPRQRDNTPLSPGPPAYSTPLTCMSPHGYGGPKPGYLSASFGHHAYLSQLSGSGFLDQSVSMVSDFSGGRRSPADETRRLTQGGWYCSHCGVHIKPGNHVSWK